MYISRQITINGYSYRICESYFDSPFFKSKVLFDLGTSPEKYITYYSDVAFSINLEDKLAEVGRKTNQFELEELFLRFLKPEAKRWVSFSLNKRTFPKESRNKAFKPQDFHWFDRIRLIAIKLDHREPQRVLDSKFPFYSRLFEKSRDEIENTIWDMEDNLNFRERSRYILAIFGLQRVFSLEERDEIFLNLLCSIAQDPAYYMDLSPHKVLSCYLSRYVWFYFDSLPWRRAPQIYQHLEINLYRELAQVLEISIETLLTSSKRDILKIFRKKIMTLHPDRGGSHEDFIRIRKLMENFLKLRF